jgi:hypothetical protein
MRRRHGHMPTSLKKKDFSLNFFIFVASSVPFGQRQSVCVLRVGRHKSFAPNDITAAMAAKERGAHAWVGASNTCVPARSVMARKA